MKTTIAFGEILWDVYPDKKFIGGASLNFAAHFASHGGFATLLSSLGDDELGHEAIEVLNSHGINTDRVSLLPDKLTGQSIVTLNSLGIPSYNVLDDVAYDYIKDNIEAGESFDALYFGTLSLRGMYNRESLRNTLQKGKFSEIFADVNIRHPHSLPENVDFAAASATIIKISDEELDFVLSALRIDAKGTAGDAARLISEKYPNLKLIIITLGEKGAICYSRDERKEYFTPATKTKVKSTVGAGDSFSAAFLYKYLSGKSIEDCLNHASRVSAFVVSETAAVPKYPEGLI